MHVAPENGDEVGSVWAVCTRDAPEHPFGSLAVFFEEHPPDPGRHRHVGDDGHELTIAIPLDDDGKSTAHVTADPRSAMCGTSLRMTTGDAPGKRCSAAYEARAGRIEYSATKVLA
jgi:hypothetical protein